MGTTITKYNFIQTPIKGLADANATDEAKTAETENATF